MSIFVFDIETVPDVESGRRLYGIEDLDDTRNYCETDVLNTYLVYQRFELIRGHLSAAQYAQVCEQLRTELQKEQKPHLSEFLDNWQGQVAE